MSRQNLIVAAVEATIFIRPNEIWTYIEVAPVRRSGGVLVRRSVRRSVNIYIVGMIETTVFI